MARRARQEQATWHAWVRAAFAAGVAASLAGGVVGGLMRLGAVDIAPHAAAGHALLMLCGLLGTVISVERAVALGRAWAFAAPALAAAAGIATLAGAHVAAALLALAASLAFVAVNAAVLGRQRAPHTVLLMAAALAWVAGNVLHATGTAAEATLALWLALPVLTIVAERLEMTRLMRRRRGAAAALYAAVTLLLAGAALTAFDARAGGIVWGAALVLLALWLLTFDIARRTIAAPGLARYMAVCLLAGYAWLALAGVAWIGMALGHVAARDTALHALALGFVFSMVFGHAPVILPAVARIKLRFSAAFYVPLALLHASLALRLLLAPLDTAWQRRGAWGNVLALAVFAATIIASALARRREASSSPRTPPEPHGHAARHR